MNKVELMRAIRLSGISKSALAKSLGISYMTLDSKLKGITEFKWSEVAMLSSLLQLTNEQFDKIFVR